MKALVINLLIFCICILIALPFPLLNILKYDVSAAHIALALSIFLLPAVLFLSKQYWTSRITIALWGLRVLAIIIFLVTYFRFGISVLDLVTVSGTIGLTFFYEMGYFFSATGYLKRFLQCLLWAHVIMIIYLFVILGPILIGGGVSGIRAHTLDIVPLFWGWPNGYGLHLVLFCWLVVFLAYKTNNKKYYLMLALILPALLFTLSRAALAALSVSILFAAWKERGRLRPATILLVFLIAGLMGYTVLAIRGSGVVVAEGIAVRELIWEPALLLWKEYPFLGLGLRSFTEAVPVWECYGATLVMGSSHNDYVDLLLRGGLLYSIPFWLFVLFVTYRGLKLKDYEGYLFPCLSYSMIALLVAGLFQNPFKEPVALAYFGVYAAAIAFYGTMQRRCR